jgi:hypothetical protein
MKHILLTIACTLSLISVYAQNTLSSQNTGSQLWIKLGDLSLPQQGSDCFLKIVGGSGYNASKYQQGYVELHIRTSNGVSVDENGYAFSATAVSYERNRFISDIRIVPNANGVNASSYAIYINCGPYPGNTYFTVEDPTGIWSPNLSSSQTHPGGYSVSFEQVINNDLFTNGNVAIGTNDTKGYKLAVAGNAIAESVTVKLQGQWGDYVFKPTYKLRPLSEVKNFIDQNQHLPEIPSAKEIEKSGIDLGEMVKLQTKKIEELTLYLIESNKQLQQQQAISKKQIQALGELRQSVNSLKAQIKK